MEEELASTARNTSFIKLSITGKDHVDDKVEVLAYDTSAPTLAVHRQVRWSHQEGKHHFVSNWQISHRDTGLAVLRPEQCPPTKEQAFDLVDALMSQGFPDDPRTDIEGSRKIRDEVVANFEYTGADEEEPEKIENRYVISHVERRFAVIDGNTGEEKERFIHRGEAAAKAKELNRNMSI